MKVVGVLQWMCSVDFLQLQVVLGLFAVLAVCFAQEKKEEPIAIVRYDNEGVNADGSYQWR